MQIDFKKWGILAIFVYILSLPIMIWRSSHIGKAISIIVMIAIVCWGAGKASDVYFAKFRYRMIVDSKMKPLDDQIKTLQKDIEKSKSDLQSINDQIQNNMNVRLDQAERQFSDKLAKASDQVEEVQKAADIIRESERAALKDKIIELREQVKIYRKSIDSAEIRKQCELVADKMFLLTKEERDRFYQDLTDIGFKVSEEQHGSVMIYGNQWGYASTGSTITCESGGTWSTVRPYRSVYTTEDGIVEVDTR